MAGLAVVACASLLALGCYLFAPDNSPDANTQILELETHPPGFTITMLKIPDRQRQQNSFLSGMLNGFEKNYKVIPILDYRIINDTLQVTLYKGKHFKPQIQSFKLSEILGYNSSTLQLNEILKKQIEDKAFEKKTYWLGTDKFGRDILSRLIVGARVSLSVGGIAVAISLLVGVLLGAMAGYFQGAIDSIIMWFVNVVWSIP
ncbi:MAG: ABC transporter permease, partial [Chitinophagales bacterium]|nr:ABC transporter permease [Chitinophagales bacterium]